MLTSFVVPSEIALKKRVAFRHKEFVSFKFPGNLCCDHQNSCSKVAVDLFESYTTGRTFNFYGRACAGTYKGGCIFVDNCSGYIHVEIHFNPTRFLENEDSGINS